MMCYKSHPIIMKLFQRMSPSVNCLSSQFASMENTTCFSSFGPLSISNILRQPHPYHQTSMLCAKFFNSSDQFQKCSSCRDNITSDSKTCYFKKMRMGNTLSRRYFSKSGTSTFLHDFDFKSSFQYSQSQNRNIVISRFASSRSDSEKSKHQLAYKILTETEKVDVMAGSISVSKVESLITQLYSLGFDSEMIKFLLSGKMWLLQDPDTTLTLCDLLLSHEIAPDLTCSIIKNIPYEFQKDAINIVSARVNESLLFLRNFGFKEYDIFCILDKDPLALLLEVNVIRLAVSRIKGYFPTNDTRKVVRQSPNVLSDDWTSIQEKFDYCYFNMGYIQSDIVKTRLFSHSLNHIKDRHLFLKRADVFQHVNKKLHPSLNPNPLLKKVVDSSVPSFVKLVEGITIEDFRVFKKMRIVERKLEGKEDSDDDDEDYNDFDDFYDYDDRFEEHKNERNEI